MKFSQLPELRWHRSKTVVVQEKDFHVDQESDLTWKLPNKVIIKLYHAYFLSYIPKALWHYFDLIVTSSEYL